MAKFNGSTIMTKLLAAILSGIILLAVGGFVGWTNNSITEHTTKITKLEIADGRNDVRTASMEKQLALIQTDIKALLSATARIEENSHRHSTEGTP